METGSYASRMEEEKKNGGAYSWRAFFDNSEYSRLSHAYNEMGVWAGFAFHRFE